MNLTLRQHQKLYSNYFLDPHQLLALPSRPSCGAQILFLTYFMGFPHLLMFFLSMSFSLSPPRILSPSQWRFTSQQDLHPHGAERKGHFSSTCWRLSVSTMSPQKDVYQNDTNLECALLGSLVTARIACHGWLISFDICTFQDLAFYYCQMGCRWFPRRSHSLPLVSFLIRILH